MNKRTLVKRYLDEGLTKDEIFYSLKCQIEEESLRKTLATIPTLEQRKKNRIIHGFLVFLLSLNLLLGIVQQIGNNFSTLYELAVEMFILISVIQYRSWIFLGGAIWFLSKFILKSYQINYILSGQLTQLELTVFIFFGIFFLFIVVLLLSIKFRVFPYTTFFVYKRNDQNEVLYK